MSATTDAGGANGTPPAFSLDEMYTRLYALIPAMMYRKIGVNRDAWVDVFHEAFTQFLEAYRRGNVWPGYENALFSIILHRACIHHYRRTRHVDAVAEPILAHHDNHIAALESEQIRATIDMIMAPDCDLLKDQDRTAWGLVRLRGVKKADLARRLHVHKSTIGRRVENVDAILRVRLAEFWPG